MVDDGSNAVDEEVDEGPNEVDEGGASGTMGGVFISSGGTASSAVSSYTSAWKSDSDWNTMSPAYFGRLMDLFLCNMFVVLVVGE